MFYRSNKLRYKADIVVTLKEGIRDPQGNAIETILKRIKFEESSKVNVGKFFTLEIEEKDEASAKLKLERIADEVLSNPVLEKYEITRFEAI